jgi:hypothetical protein
MSESAAVPKKEQAVSSKTDVEAKESAAVAQNGADGSGEQVEGEKKPSKKGGTCSLTFPRRYQLTYNSQEGGQTR